MKFLTFIFLFSYTLVSYGQAGDDVYQFTDSTGTYNVHVYTSVGANIFEVVPYVTKVDVLIVGGGGGGAGYTSYSSAGGGAGGAGGLVFDSAYTVTSGATISVVIGGGGSGINSTGTAADNGEDSAFDGIKALGGGGGILTGGNNNNPAKNGGSGGGGRKNPAGLATQPTSSDGGFGNNGARNSTDNGGAGGGGAGAQPTDISGNDGGAGGDGLDYGAIFGTVYGDSGYFAAGGGGGGDANGALEVGGQGGGGYGSSARDNIAPTSGMPNTGGGGGGGSSDHAGADGGSGIILIRYLEQPSPLPVELLSFNVAFVSTEVFLTWSTASEKNNDYFTLERSKDGILFNIIGTVGGAGNSSNKINYKFIDKSPKSGVSYYRLKQTDYNGDYDYSEMKSVVNNNDTSFNIYPNPVTSGQSISLDFTMDKNEIYYVELLDLMGRTVRSEILKSTDINISLPRGEYIIRVTSKNTIYTEKIIIY